MAIFASIVAALMEFGGVGTIGYAWFHSAASGTEIHSGRVQELRGPFRPFDIALDPSMSPVEFYLRVWVDGTYLDVGGMRREESHNYRGTLSLDRKPVMDTVVQIKSDAWSKDETQKRPMRTSLAVKTFGPITVPAAGRYQFALNSAGGSIPTAFRDAEVFARRNVKGVEMKKVWWGIGLIVFGGLIQLMFGAPLPGSRND